MLKSIIEIILNILILFLISILISIYLISNIDEHELDDCTEIETESNFYLNLLQEEFNDFLALFRKNPSKNFLEKKTPNNLKELEEVNIERNKNSNENIHNSIILKEVYDLHFESIVKENIDLNEKISLLELEILKQKINRLNTLKMCDDLTKDLNHELNNIKNRNSI